MKTILFLLCFSLVGCIEEENCWETDVVERTRYETTEFYTIAIPVYKMECE